MSSELSWIVEGILTTTTPDGSVHLAPMGPRVTTQWDRILLRPFQSSTTFANLQRQGQAVFHVSDDVLLLAQAAVGRVTPTPPVVPTQRIRGWRLQDCCRWYEVEVEDIDSTAARALITARVVASGRERDFLGLNRAAFAVVELAIQATRLHLLPRSEIQADLERWQMLVAKTGSPREQAALDLLVTHIRQTWAERGL
jgi:hypothetical protein